MERRKTMLAQSNIMLERITSGLCTFRKGNRKIMLRRQNKRSEGGGIKVEVGEVSKGSVRNTYTFFEI